MSPKAYMFFTEALDLLKSQILVSFEKIFTFWKQKYAETDNKIKEINALARFTCSNH